MYDPDIKNTPVLFAISGWKNSGKTTVMEALIRGLTEKGYRVASVKHDGHDFEADREGTDSFRHLKAGAYGAAVFSSRKFQIVKAEKEPELSELIQYFPEADVILIEGLKGEKITKYICRYPEVVPDIKELQKQIEEKIWKERRKNMTVEKLMEMIKLPEEERQAVTEFPIEESFYQAWKSLFYENSEQFFEETKKRTDKDLLLLVLYIRFAADRYKEFQKRGITDEVYFDTFFDITIWAACHRKKFGTIGLMEEKWLSLALQNKIYRLGRLQFEPDEENGILHVHIPEGEGFTNEACEEAFQKAEAFFGPSFSMYDCESWLLSPALEEMLDENSNIIRFQKRFHILKTVYPFRQAEQRVFGEIREQKENYPENTSLQKALKRYVADGKDPGIGYGVIYRGK